MVGERVQNAEKKKTCCIKIELSRSEGDVKTNRNLRRAIEREMEDVDSIWNELRWLSRTDLNGGSFVPTLHRELRGRGNEHVGKSPKS